KPAYNVWVGSSLGQALMRRAGLTALPEMPALSLAREARRMGVAVATPERMRKLTEAQRQQAVVFVLDAFTAHFDPAVGLAALQLARKMGFTPYLAHPTRTARPCTFTAISALSRKPQRNPSAISTNWPRWALRWSVSTLP
ncbi:hypothetical protein JS562_55625, partial [Agrobacterium sp. S2]|nr:hypothetical protein [Agrobacterium sp. S2]